jgi:hypothetical protein
MDPFAYSVLQKKLYLCLNYFLYGSISCRHLSHYYTSKRLKSKLLKDWVNALDMLGFNESIHTPSSIPPILSVSGFAEYLSDFYTISAQLVSKIGCFNEVKRLSEGQAYEDWLDAGGVDHRYWPVHRLKEIFKSQRNVLFLKGIIHGSVGTLDDVAGFSDLDLAFIVKKEVLCDKAQLLKLRAFNVDALCLTYAFDPYMHHGPYYISEIDLPCYPESLFPSVLFKYGVDLGSQKNEILYRGYTADIFADDLFVGYHKYFRTFTENHHYIDNSYDLELLLGSITILPALFLQRITGVYRYKRDTFSEAMGYFDEDLWRPITTATELRRELKPRWRPRKDQVEKAFIIKWPGLLQRLALERYDEPERYSVVNQKICEGLMADVVTLCLSMKQRLSKINLPCHLHSTSSPGGLEKVFFGHLMDEECTDLPFNASFQDYEDAKQSLINAWTTLEVKPVSIYQIGSVNAPGHSDLDFVVVWPEEHKIPYAKFHPASFDTAMGKYLVHAPYFCTHELWKGLYTWYPTFDIKHLWGAKLEMPIPVSKDLKLGLALSHLVDTLITKMPEDLLHYALQRPVRLRVVINTLYSMKYTIELAKMAGLGVSTEHEGFAIKVKALRDQWFVSLADSKNALIYLCSEALRIIEEIQSLTCAKITAICRTKGTSTGREVFSSLQSLAQYWRGYVECRHPNHFPVPTEFLDYLGFYRSLAPQMLTSLEKFGKVSDVFCSDEYYLPGIKCHVRSMAKYAECMIPLGVPPSKYLSLGYSPLNKRDDEPQSSSIELKKRKFKLMIKTESVLDNVDTLIIKRILNIL